MRACKYSKIHHKPRAKQRLRKIEQKRLNRTQLLTAHRQDAKGCIA